MTSRSYGIDIAKPGVYLENKPKTEWDDSGSKCVMLFPRSLRIEWVHRPDKWEWKFSPEISSEVVKIIGEEYLDIKGKFKVSDLSPDVEYKITFVVMLEEEQSGWELPIKLKLELPGVPARERQVSLLEKPRGEWIELNVGSFRSTRGGGGEVLFCLYEHELRKSGLVIKGAILRPVTSRSMP